MLGYTPPSARCCKQHRVIATMVIGMHTSIREV